MSYNKFNVWLVDRQGFVDYTQTRILQSYSRPTFEILADGDSWFHFGGFTGGARNVLETITFNKHHTILCNMAMLGDHLENISGGNYTSSFKRSNSKYYQDMLKKYKWDGLIISCGGNDLIAALTKSGGYRYKGKTLSIIQKNEAGVAVSDFINQSHLDLFIESLLKNYRLFFSKVARTQNADTRVYMHTYDYPTARPAPAKAFFNKVGPWLHKAFKANDIPENIRQDIVKFLFNQLAVTIISLENEIPNLTVIKTHGTLIPAAPDTKASSNDWLNEIHPNDEGLHKIGEVFSKTLSKDYENAS